MADDTLDRPPEDGDTLEQALGETLAAPDGAAPLLVEGTVVAGKYRLDGTLGRGGMGRVYRATHLGTGGQVALKVMHPEAAASQAARERFRLEARNAAALRHVNTARVSDYGTDGGLAYLVMEHVDGAPLSDIIQREGPQPWRRVVHLVGQVLKSLWEAHEHPRRIVHRDIKPANVLVCDLPGSPDVVKVLDFGISRALDATTAGTQGVVGSPQTMAPEQWLGEAVDARTDLYAVGCTAYQLISGRLVFETDSALSLGHLHLHETPTALGTLAPDDTPPSLLAWVERMMAKAPGDRYASASEALQVLQAIARDPEHAVVTKAPAKGRSRWVWTAALAAVAVLSVLLVFMMRPGQEVSATGAEFSAASPAQGPPYRRRCDDTERTGDCPAGEGQWCDERGRPFACCSSGLVPDGADGVCGCPPGGVSEPSDHTASCATGKKLSSAEIRTAIRRATPDIRACYQQSLDAAETAAAQGTVHISFAVGPLGEVYRVRVKRAAFGDSTTQRCVLERLRQLRFRPPAGGWVEVTYPFRFSPGGP